MNWYLRKEWNFITEETLTRDYFAFSPNAAILFNWGKNLVLHAALSRKNVS